MSIKLSHTDKIYWPDEKITKGELIQYYLKVAKILLKYTKDRPLMMRRFPNGIKGEAFYQKDVGDIDLPKFVKTVEIIHSNRRVRYIVAQNAKTIAFIANLGSIEMHLFHSRIKKLDRPDYMILDLDPLSISFDAVVDTALVIHKILQNLKIPNFCKTSGGDGLHIYIPLNGKYTYEESRHFAMIIAKLAHKVLPDITSLERSPKKREKRVYIDTLQNSKGQLTVAPYSVRAKSGGPVSTPLSWKEIKHGLDPKNFNIQNVAKRLTKKGDLFKGVLGKGANLKNFEKYENIETSDMVS